MPTVTVYVSTQDDNGYQWPASTWYNDSPKTGKTYTGLDVDCAVRFQNITISPGATITSAYLSLQTWYDQTRDLVSKVSGMDEDNTATLTSNPMGRSETSAKVDWDQSATFVADTSYSSPDIKTVIQEIINRGGWSSGNAIGLFVKDDGSSPNDGQNSFYSYAQSLLWSPGTSRMAKLVINYTGSSPSSSQSPSSSSSASPSLSPSASQSPSSSPSPSPSASPSPMIPFHGMRIAKEGQDVLNTDSPYNMKFDSNYGTLKYFDKQTIQTELDANDGEVACSGSYTHDLGYYPFVEVFVRVYIGSPSGGYQYCPFAGSGATVFYGANYKITTDKIYVYGEILGVSSSLWHFDFLVFIYKNDLKLS